MASARGPSGVAGPAAAPAAAAAAAAAPDVDAIVAPSSFPAPAPMVPRRPPGRGEQDGRGERGEGRSGGAAGAGDGPHQAHRDHHHRPRGHGRLLHQGLRVRGGHAREQRGAIVSDGYINVTLLKFKVDRYGGAAWGCTTSGSRWKTWPRPRGRSRPWGRWSWRREPHLRQPGGDTRALGGGAEVDDPGRDLHRRQSLRLDHPPGGAGASEAGPRHEREHREHRDCRRRDRAGRPHPPLPWRLLRAGPKGSPQAASATWGSGTTTRTARWWPRTSPGDLDAVRRASRGTASPPAWPSRLGAGGGPGGPAPAQRRDRRGPRRALRHHLRAQPLPQGVRRAQAGHALPSECEAYFATLRAVAPVAQRAGVLIAPKPHMGVTGTGPTWPTWCA